MAKYRVKSGDLDMEIKADSRERAAMKAIELGSPKTLGILIGIRKKGESSSKETFMLTQQILEKMGQPVLTEEQAERYKKEVNPKYYKELRINELDSKKPKHFLTREEFRAGKPGYVWFDETSGKLRFTDDAKETEQAPETTHPN